MKSAISIQYETLEMVDICLDNFRKSQLDQMLDLDGGALNIIEFFAAVLFACQQESSTFVLFYACHNIHGFDCFRNSDWSLWSKKRAKYYVSRKIHL